MTSTDVGGKTFSLYPFGNMLFIGDETDGLARVAIDTNGKVGIGTASPSSALHVVGDLTLTGTGNIRKTERSDCCCSAANNEDPGGDLPGSERRQR